MDQDVTTCHPDDRINKVMQLMTVHRVRHLPVMEGNRLIGIVSIGDLVKHQLEEKEREANVLRDRAMHAPRGPKGEVIVTPQLNDRVGHETVQRAASEANTL